MISKKLQRARSIGRCAVVLPLLTMGMLPTPAIAQDDGAIEEIVIMGHRLQNRSAIDTKRQSTRIGDFLAQDDLGRTPDLNIADSLRRAPGVNTVFDEDEGRYVSVRGLESNFTYIAVDGSQISSVDRNSRRINTEMISPTVVKRLDIYKTLTPDLDGNAIGGYIDLVTRSAFDTDDRQFVASALIGSHSYNNVPGGDGDVLSPRLDLLYSDQFGSNDQFGLVLSGTYFDKTRDQSKNRVGAYGTANDGSGNVTASRFQSLDYHNTIERRSILGKFEVQASDRVYAYLQAGYFDYQYDEHRYFTTLTGANLEPNSGLAGTYADGNASFRFNTFPLNLNVRNVQAVVEFDIDDESSLHFAYQNSKGTNDEPSQDVRWSAGTQPELGYSYVVGAAADGLAALQLENQTFFNDLSNYAHSSYRPSRFRMEETVDEFKVDYERHISDQFTVKTGLKYRELDKNFDNSQTFYNYLPGGLNAGEFQNSQPYESPYFTTWTPPFFFVGEWLNFFNTNRSDFEINQASTDAANIRSDFQLQEDVTAVYLMGTYSTDNWDFSGGLRYEKTDVATNAVVNNDGTYEPVSRSSDYNDVLPSFVATYNIDDDMRLRFAYSQAIGRPNHTDLARAETRDTIAPDLIEISQGNPDLKPRKSDNYDVAFDWFIDDGQFLSAAYFHKDISDQIFSGTTATTVGGISYEITRPENVSDATVSGIEFSYVDDSFDFLPAPFDGFGILFNATYIDGSSKIPMNSGETRKVTLIEQPDLLLNASLLYTIGDLQAKLAFNRTGDWHQIISTSSANSDRIEAEYDQWDLHVRYNLTDNWTLMAEGRNLTDNNPRVETFGTGLTRTTNEFGQSIWFGASLSF